MRAMVVIRKCTVLGSPLSPKVYAVVGRAQAGWLKLVTRGPERHHSSLVAALPSRPNTRWLLQFLMLRHTGCSLSSDAQLVYHT